MAEIDPQIYSRALHFAVDAIDNAIVKFGSGCTYEHIMSVLAESATRELPRGTHYLRNAVDMADATAAADKKAQEEWELAREAGWYGLGRVK